MDKKLKEIINYTCGDSDIPTSAIRAMHHDIQALISSAEIKARISWLEEQTADIDEAIVLWRKNERKHHTWLLAWLEDNKQELAELTKGSDLVSLDFGSTSDVTNPPKSALKQGKGE